MNRFPWRPMLLGAICVYFAFHTLHGERGLYALFKQLHYKDVISEELVDVTAKRTSLELQVKGMRSESLDKDLLDQQVRAMLGYVGPNEMIVLAE
ncbi:MAG: septum formation initiator family protein [Rickettsiales bacterium]|nr:septum formation initiator family protein [Rickettsiales bacterium]